MTLQVLVPPVGEPVSLPDAKAVLRVTDASEDELITRLISAARQRIERSIGACLIATTLRETFDNWASRLNRSGAVRLTMGPLLSISAVRIGNGSGEFETLAPERYRAALGTRPALIIPQGAGLPGAGVRSAGLQVDYRCGFGETAADVPEPLRQAILALVAHAFENRDQADAPLGLVEPWLASYRRVRL